MEIETDSKSDVLSVYWQNRTAPQLKRVRLVSVLTATPEGGVVVRFSTEGCLAKVAQDEE
jgi:hypothetical protein